MRFFPAGVTELDMTTVTAASISLPSLSAFEGLDPLLAEAVLLLRASEFNGDAGDDWRNEGTGGSALDAVADGEPAYVTSPEPGFEFADGSSGTPDVGPFYSVPDHALIDPGAGSFTALARFRTTEVAAENFENIMIKKDDATEIGAGASAWAMVDDVGFFDGVVGIVSNAGEAPPTNPALVVNDPAANLTLGEHLLVLRLDRADDSLELFIDGVLKGTLDASAVTTISSTGDLILGRANEQTGRDYGYWPRALTDTEITVTLPALLGAS